MRGVVASTDAVLTVAHGSGVASVTLIAGAGLWER